MAVRGPLLASAILAVTIGAGAAFGIAAADRPDAEVARPAEAKSSTPSFDPRERLVLTEAQIYQARATGALDRDVKSILAIDERLRHGDYRWNEKGVPPGEIWIRVDLDSQIVSAFRGGHEIGTAVILYGARDKNTPTGVFPVQWKKKDHHSSTYDAPMPYTLRLTDDGIAIHGSDVRWGAATHGCIGVPLEFARHLFEATKPGDSVRILRSGSATSA